MQLYLFTVATEGRSHDRRSEKQANGFLIRMVLLLSILFWDEVFKDVNNFRKRMSNIYLRMRDNDATFLLLNLARFT